MNTGGPGIKASELIEKLQKLIETHGDRQVYTIGGDYPEGCKGVWLQTRNDQWMPRGVFYV